MGVMIENVVLFFCEIFLPESDIDIRRNFDSESYLEQGPLNFGNPIFDLNQKSHSDLNLIHPNQANQRSSSSDHLKPIRLLVGSSERVIRSDVGGRAIRYETTRVSENQSSLANT